MKRTVRIISVLLAFAMIFSLGTIAAFAEEGEDKVITVGLVTDVTPMNCIEPKTEIGSWTLQLLYPTLVTIDENLEFVYQIAESITTEDNLVFTIHLNPDAVWSDGEPVTAEDVYFSFDVYTDPVVGATVWSDFFTSLADVEDSGWRAEGAALDCVKIVDEHTLEVTCGREMTLDYFLSLTALNLCVLPEHVLGGVDRADLLESAEAMACEVVDGPFYLYDETTGSEMVFAANENYYKGCPKIDYLRFVFLTSAQLASQLESGEIDMVWPGLIDTADYDYISQLDNVVTSVGVPNKIVAMFINNEVVSDKAVRQAMSLAVDRAMLVENVMGGYAETATVPLSSVSKYWFDDIEEVEYDPDKAAELLAGTDFDYTQPLTLTITAGNTTLKNVALIVKSELEALGFHIEIEESDTAVRNILMGEYQLGFVTQTEKPLFPAHCLGINVFSQIAWTKFSDEHADELYASLSSVITPEELSDNMREIEEIVLDEVPSVSLYNSFPLLAVNERVTVGGPKVYGMFVDVELWDVE